MCLWTKADVKFYWIIVCSKSLQPKFIVRLLEGHFFFFCRFYRNIQFLCLYNRCRAILLMEMLLINPYYYYYNNNNNYYYYYYYYYYYFYYYYYYYHFYYCCCYTCLFISSISLVAWVFTAFASSLLFCSCSCTASSCALMDWIPGWMLSMAGLTSK